MIGGRGRIYARRMVMRAANGMARALWCWAAAALLGLSGCAFKGQSADVPPMLDVAVWQPGPVALRIFPSTRYVQEQGQPLLEARIELLDAMGDSIKAAGQMQLELFASDPAGLTLGRRLYLWNAAVLTLEDQREHYDPITRTYLFRLELDDLAVTQRPTVLRATFVPAAGGKRLQTQAAMR